MGGQSIWSSGQAWLVFGQWKFAGVRSGNTTTWSGGTAEDWVCWSRCGLQAEGLADGLANMACGFTVVVCPRDLRESNFDYIFNTV